MNQAEIIVKNMQSELNISTSYNKIKLENNTGPMNIKSLYGSIDAVFSGEIKGPVSIVSVYEYVDVSLPAATKANVEIATSYGKLYAADGLKIAVEPNAVKKEESRVTGLSRNSGERIMLGETLNASGETIFGYNTETIKGKLNGGGTDVILKSNYKNVYLRVK